MGRANANCDDCNGGATAPLPLPSLGVCWDEPRHGAPLGCAGTSLGTGGEPLPSPLGCAGTSLGTGGEPFPPPLGCAGSSLGTGGSPPPLPRGVMGRALAHHITSHPFPRVPQHIPEMIANSRRYRTSKKQPALRCAEARPSTYRGNYKNTSAR